MAKAPKALLMIFNDDGTVEWSSRVSIRATIPKGEERPKYFDDLDLEVAFDDDDEDRAGDTWDLPLTGHPPK